MSDEERKEMVQEMHRRFHSFSEEEKYIINQKRIHTFRNKYETYKEEKYLETSEIKKEVLDTFTDITRTAKEKRFQVLI